MNTNKCPVCGFLMEYPADDDNICPSCGTHFGYHDYVMTHEELRVNWLKAGAPWFDPQPAPPRWDAIQQLKSAGLIAATVNVNGDAITRRNNITNTNVLHFDISGVR